MRHKKTSIAFLSIVFMLCVTTVALNAISINDIQSKIDAINAEKAKKVAELESSKSSLESVSSQITELNSKQDALLAELNATEDQITDINSQVLNTEILIPIYMDKTNSILGVLQKNSHNNFLIDSLFSKEASPGESARKAYVSGKLSEAAINIVNETIKLQNDLIVHKSTLENKQAELALQQAELNAQDQYLATLFVKARSYSNAVSDEVAYKEVELKAQSDLIELMQSAGCSGDQVYGVDCGQIDASSGFIRPIASGQMGEEFGYSPGYPGNHTGIDIVTCGIPIYAPANGKVVSVTHNDQYMGNNVVLVHNVNGRQVSTSFSHMSGPPLVSRGQNVDINTQLGTVGYTGYVIP
ncbi:MAG: murein hydrolase activator EnvC family protein, partial [Mycoplasmatales bacterium]